MVSTGEEQVEAAELRPTHMLTQTYTMKNDTLTKLEE